MIDNYSVIISDAFGNNPLEVASFNSLDYTAVENDIGPLILKVPGGIDMLPMWHLDGLIEVWRSVAGGAPYLDMDKLWLLRGWKWHTQARQAPYWTLRAFDLNHLLKRRDVDYTQGNAYTAKVAPADNMGKAIMRENAGSLATDTTRSWATYLDIQADQSLAPTLYKEFARQNVLKVLQDLARASYQAGTYLVFDVVCTVPPSSGSAVKFEFRSYTGQRGIDHTFPNGNPPLLIGPDFNNLDNVDYDYDAAAEVTRGIAAGQAFGISQAVARANDTTRQGQSPFGLIESTRNAGGTADASALQDEADAELRGGIPWETLMGRIVNTSGLLYGLDWKWGDKVTGQVGAIARDAHIDRVHVVVERDTGEQIDGSIRSVVA